MEQKRTYWIVVGDLTKREAEVIANAAKGMFPHREVEMTDRPDGGDMVVKPREYRIQHWGK